MQKEGTEKVSQGKKKCMTERGGRVPRLRHPLKVKVHDGAIGKPYDITDSAIRGCWDEMGRSGSK